MARILDVPKLPLALRNSGPIAAAPIHTEFSSEHFLNRELSWLAFNARVLEEAEDESNPLLERTKFLSIFSSNLDEFFMVRVSGLREQAFGDGAPQDFAPDGMRPLQQLERLAVRSRELVAAQYACWNDQVKPGLAEQGIRILTMDEVSSRQREFLNDYFWENMFPILTPMAIDPSHPSPRYHNRAIYLATLLEKRQALGPNRMFAVLQLPPKLPRLVRLDSGSSERQFVLLEDLLAERLPDLFGGFHVVCHTTFRITRDNDIELMAQEADDMLSYIEERIRLRQRAVAVRLEVAADANPELVTFIVRDEELRTSASEASGYSEIHSIPGMLDLTALNEFNSLEGYESLREAPHVPHAPRGIWPRRDELFKSIAAKDILLHHPFESFEPVVEFVRAAAEDPKVLAIKQTLYRTGGDSPILQALIKAAGNGKQVTVVVELQARFDEAANVDWARKLERAGVHVVFGFTHLKTHCKLCLVVRQEGSELRRYVHISTGNYNTSTAKLYTDLGLFTAERAFGVDASALFNLLTGYSQGHAWQKLVVANEHLHERTIELINEQADRASHGFASYIFAKCNALVDYQVIEALYRASQAGVPIDLVVRGVCCLKPGLPGVSETINVRSVVDRFLEHSRIFVFGKEHDAKVFIGSADWMPRNFHRRIEAMAPIEDEDLRRRILEEIMPAYLRDDKRARILRADGVYVRAERNKNSEPYRVQFGLAQNTQG